MATILGGGILIPRVAIILVLLLALLILLLVLLLGNYLGRKGLIVLPSKISRTKHDRNTEMVASLPSDMKAAALLHRSVSKRS
jgi:hypothetical protein